MTRSTFPSEGGSPYLKIAGLLVTTSLFGFVALAPLVDALLIAEPDWLSLASVVGFAIVVTGAVSLYPHGDYSVIVGAGAVVATGVYLLAGLVFLTPGPMVEGSLYTLAERSGLLIGSLAFGLLVGDILESTPDSDPSD